jgi:hypothetical protein
VGRWHQVVVALSELSKYTHLSGFGKLDTVVIELPPVAPNGSKIIHRFTDLQQPAAYEDFSDAPTIFVTKAQYLAKFLLIIMPKLTRWDGVEDSPLEQYPSQEFYRRYCERTDHLLRLFKEVDYTVPAHKFSQCVWELVIVNQMAKWEEHIAVLEAVILDGGRDTSGRRWVGSDLSWPSRD